MKTVPILPYSMNATQCPSGIVTRKAKRNVLHLMILVIELNPYSIFALKLG